MLGADHGVREAFKDSSENSCLSPFISGTGTLYTSVDSAAEHDADGVVAVLDAGDIFFLSGPGQNQFTLSLSTLFASSQGKVAITRGGLEKLLDAAFRFMADPDTQIPLEDFKRAFEFFLEHYLPASGKNLVPKAVLALAYLNVGQPNSVLLREFALNLSQLVTPVGSFFISQGKLAPQAWNGIDDGFVYGVFADPKGRLTLGGVKALCQKGQGELCARIENGYITHVFNARGQSVLTGTQKLAMEPVDQKRMMWAGAGLGADGQVKGGVLIGSANQNVASELFARYPDCVVTNLTFSNQGLLRFAGQLLCERKNFKGQTVHAAFKDGKLCRVCSAEDGSVMVERSELKKFSFWAGAALGEDGKVSGGREIEPEFKTLPSDILDTYPDSVITDVVLDVKGRFYFAGRERFSKAKYAGRKVNILIEGKKVKKVVDADSGEVLLGKSSLAKRQLYAGAVLGKNAKPEGGTLVSSIGRVVPASKLEGYTHAVVTNVAVSDTGTLSIAGQSKYSLDDYAGQLVNVEFEDGRMVKAASVKDGHVVFDFNSSQYSQVWADSSLADDGTIEKGRLVGPASRNTLSRLMAEHPDCVVTRLEVSGDGRIFAGGRDWTVGRQFAGRTVDVAFESGLPVKMADSESSDVLLDKTDFSKRSLYAGAHISEKGKIKSGVFVGVANQNTAAQLLDAYPDCVVVNLVLGSRGRLWFAGKNWCERKEFEGDVVNAQFEGGKLVRLSRVEDGEIIFDKLDSCQFYAGGTLNAAGSLEGGKRLGHAGVRNISTLLEQFPDAVVCDVTVTDSGHLEIGRRMYRPELAGQRVHALFEEGELKKVVLAQNGEKVFPEQASTEIFADTVGLGADGTVVGGHKAEQVGGEFWKTYADSVLANIVADRNGKVVWQGRVLFEDVLAAGELLNLRYVGSTLVEVCSARSGQRFFKLHDFGAKSVFPGAQLDNDFVLTQTKGKPVVVDSADAQVIEKFPDAVICGLSFDMKGRLRLGSKCVMVRSAFAGMSALVQVSDGELSKVGLIDGTKVYVRREQKPKTLWVNSGLKADGTVVEGTKVGEFVNFVPDGVMRKHPDCVVQNAMLNSAGQLRLGKEVLFYDTRFAKKLTNALIKDGKLEKLVLAKNGEVIFPNAGYDEIKVYPNAVIDPETAGVVAQLKPTAYKRTVPASVFASVPAFVVEGLSLDASGVLKLKSQKWFSNPDLAGVKVNARFEGARLVQLYTQDGQCLVDNAKDGLAVYVADKSRWDNWRFSGFTAQQASRLGDFVLTNVALPPQSVAKSPRKVFFCGRPVDFGKLEESAQWLDVVFSNSRPVEIYDDKGRFVWSEQSYPVSAATLVERDNAKLPYSCAKTSGFRTQVSDSFVQKNRNFTVCGISASKRGDVAVAGQRVFMGAECMGLEGLLVDFKDAVINRVYDWDGNVYFDRALLAKMDQPNAVWLRYPGEKGGKFINAWPHGLPSDLLDRYPSCWVTGIDETNRLLAPAFANLKHVDQAEREHLIAGFKDGALKTVMLANGKKVYDWEKPFVSVYKDAVLKNGKLVSGQSVHTGINSVPFDVISQNPDCVVCGIATSGRGYLEIGARKWPLPLKAGLRQLTVVFKNGVLHRVYSASGKLLAQIDANSKNAVFSDFKIDEQGRMAGGEFVFAYPGGISSRMAQEMSDFAVANVTLNARGGLSIGGGVVWEGKASYAGHKVNVVFKNGQVDAVYLPGTGIIYSYFDEYPELNSLYDKPKIENGKLVSGQLVGHYAGRNSRQLNDALVESLENAAFDNVPFAPDGSLKLCSTNLLPPNALYAGGVHKALVKVTKGRIENVFDQDGKGIWPVFNGVDIRSISDNVQHTQVPLSQTTKLLDDAFDGGKLDGMVEILGLKGTVEILSGMLGIDNSTVSTYLTGLVFTGVFDHKFTPSPEGVFSFHNMRRISPAILDQINRHSSGFEGFYRAVKNGLYKSVVADPRFLERLAAESINEKNNIVLRRVYKQILEHFAAVASLPVNGINEQSRLLKFYQREGVKFILENKKVILADDQGVGKTLQVIAAALNINEGAGTNKTLIICPYGAKQVWEDEINTSVLGDAKPYIIDSLSELENPVKKKRIEKARFVIVNYAAIRAGEEHLQEQLADMGFDFVAVDEAHKLRNESLQTSAVRRFKAPYQVLVTGTPLVGRKVGKIYNLLNWLYPDVFANTPQAKHFFASTFARNGTTMRSLGAMLDFFVLRRLKNDVLVELPLRDFINHYIETDPEHRAFYAKVYEVFSSRSYDTANMGQVIALIQKLKKTALHPELERQSVLLESKTKGGQVVELSGTDESFELNGKTYACDNMSDFFAVSHVTAPDGTEYISRHVPGPSKLITIDGQDFYINNALFKQDSAKFKKLRQIIADARKDGQSVVVFTTYRNAVAAVAREFGANYLVGNMSRRARKRQIESFSQHGGVFVSTFGSGGETITLTKASQVVLLDQPWTAQDKNQAIDRIYRLGQQMNVTVHSLIATNTIDEHVAACIDESQLVFDMVFDSASSAQSDQQGNIKRIVESLQGAKQKKAVSKAHESLSAVYKNHVYETDFAKHITRTPDGKFSAYLEDGYGQIQEFTSFEGLLQGFGLLSAGSRQMVAEFVKDALVRDFIEDRKISQTLFWELVCSMRGILRQVDYHPEIYRGTVSGVAVAAVMLGADIDSVEGLEEFIGMPGVVNEGLRFCDRENIFKALSFLGVLDKGFYYSADLLKSYSMQSFSFGNGRVSFRDEELVNTIVPGVLGSLSAVKQLAWPDAQGRLALEARRGNIAARDALLLGCAEASKGVAFRVRKGMLRRFPSRMAAKIPDVEVLVQDSWEIILEQIDNWYEEIAVKPIEEIVQRELPKLLNKKAYAHMRDSLKQIELLDAPVGQEEKGATYGDLYFSHEVDYVESIEPEVPAFAGDTAAFDIVREVLGAPENGFMDHEIDCFIMHVAGMGTEQIQQQLAREGTNVSAESVAVVIEDAVSILAGEEFFRNMLAGRQEARARNDDFIQSMEQEREFAGLELKSIMAVAAKTLEAGSLTPVESQKLSAVYADLMLVASDGTSAEVDNHLKNVLRAMSPGWNLAVCWEDGMVECGEFAFYMDADQVERIVVYYDEENNLRFLDVQSGDMAELFSAGKPFEYVCREGRKVTVDQNADINDLFEHDTATAGSAVFSIFGRWKPVGESAVGVCSDQISLELPEDLKPFIKARRGLFAGNNLVGLELFNELTGQDMSVQVRGNDVFVNNAQGDFDTLGVDGFNRQLDLRRLAFESALVWGFFYEGTNGLASAGNIEKALRKGNSRVKLRVLELLEQNRNIPLTGEIVAELGEIKGQLEPFARRILNRSNDDVSAPGFAELEVARCA